MRCQVVVGCLLLSALPLAAQTSLDTIEQELKQVKQQHDEASSQVIKELLATLESAMQSPSVALDLYQKAGGSLPDAAPVRTRYEHETPSEKAVREAQDAVNFSSVAVVIQVHCGLMRFAALQAVNPDLPNLHNDWLKWLKSTGALYPQLAGRRVFKDVAVRDSVISTYLGFHGWGDKPSGGWNVSALPAIYRDQILEPLRKPLQDEAVEAWDIYIAMRQADEVDKQKWSQEIEPVLEFDRGADDFTLVPTIEKLGSLMTIVKANPSHAKLTEWVTRMHAMLQVYRENKPGASSGSSGAASATNAPPAGAAR